jgi:hypothetical protein
MLINDANVSGISLLVLPVFAAPLWFFDRMTSSLSLLSALVPISSSSELSASSIDANADAVSTDESSSKPGLNPPALISIAAGAGAVVLLLVLIAIFIILRHRRRKKLYPRPRAAPPNDEKRSLDPGAEAAASMISRTPSHKRSISVETGPNKLRRKHSGRGPTYQSVTQRHQLDQGIAKLDGDLGLGTGDMSSLPSPTGFKSGLGSLTLDEEQETPIPEGKRTVSSAITSVEQQPLDPFSSGFLPPPSPASSEYIMIDADHAPEMVNGGKPSLDIPLKNIGLPGSASIQSLNVFIDSPGGKPSAEVGALPFPVTTGSSSKNRRTSRPSLESNFSSFHMPTRPTRSESQDHGFDDVPLNPFDVHSFPVPFEVTTEEESTPPIMPPPGANGALTAPRRKDPSVSSADMYKFSPASQKAPLGSVVSLEVYQGREHPNKSEAAISIPDQDRGRTSYEPLPMPALPAPTISLTRNGSNTPGSSRLKKPPPQSRQFSSSSNLNRGAIFGKHKHSASVTSLREYKELGTPTVPRARSPTMTDANQYDFDIYQHREDDQSEDATTSQKSPIGRRPRLSLVTGVGTSGNNTEQDSPITISLSQTSGGSIGLTSGYKRFSASVGDLPFGGNPLHIGGSLPMRPSPLGNRSLGRGSKSKQTEGGLNGDIADAGSSGEVKIPERAFTPPNLYIPKERLDGGARPFS